MSEKNTIEVLICGKIIHLSGYESEEYLQKVAQYLNHKQNELSELPGFRRMPSDLKTLLLSLNVSDDYFKAKDQADVLTEDMQKKEQEVYDLKHEIVNLQMQIENLKKEAAAKPVAAVRPVESRPAAQNERPAENAKQQNTKEHSTFQKQNTAPERPAYQKQDKTPERTSYQQPAPSRNSYYEQQRFDP